MNIPKILHYLWIGPYTDSQTYVDDWLAVQEGYELIKWTNQNTKQYIDEAVNLFGKDSLRNKGMTYVSDLVRLLILRDHGGIYIDHDIALLKDFTPLIEDYDLVLTFQYRKENIANATDYERGTTMIDIVVNKGYGVTNYSSTNVNNCFIAVTKNNKLIQRAIELTLDNHFKQESEQYPMSDWGVGPSVFTDLVNEYGISTVIPTTVSKDNVIVYDSEYLHPVHGVEKMILGREEYKTIIDRIIETKSSYAVHAHEHFGANSFIEGKLKLFVDWYDNEL